MKTKIIIIGGGLGGLCLAQALKKENIDFEVFESCPVLQLRNQGYRINLNPEGLDALQQCLPVNLYNAVLDSAGSGGSRAIVFDDQLGVIYQKQGSGGDERLPVNRQTLREILLHDLDKHISLNKTCTGVAEKSGRVTAHFADGSTAVGDLLVAADGANSIIKKQLLPEAKLVPTGYGCIYGKILLTDENASLIPGGCDNVFTGVVAPGNKTLIIGTYRKKEAFNAINGYLPRLTLTSQNDYLMCALLGPLTNFGLDAGQFKSSPPPELKAIAKDAVLSWHPWVRQLINKIDTETIFPVNLRYSTTPAHLPFGNIAFTGDSIHTMLPAGGAGANTAFKDAALLGNKLSASLTTGSGLHEAIQSYHHEMLQYGAAAIIKSLQNAQLFYRMPAINL